MGAGVSAELAGTIAAMTATIPGPVLVAGAGPGLGASLAVRFATQGCDVVLLGRDAGRLAELTSAVRARVDSGLGGGTVSSVVGDLRDGSCIAAIETAAAEVGEFEVVLFNASTLTMGRFSELTPDQLLDGVALGVGGLSRVCAATVPSMRSRRHGAVVVSGGGTALRPWPAAAALGVQKAALRSATLALASELRTDRVTAGIVTVNGTMGGGTDLDQDEVAKVFFELAVGIRRGPEIVLEPGFARSSTQDS